MTLSRLVIDAARKTKSGRRWKRSQRNIGESRMADLAHRDR